MGNRITMLYECRMLVQRVQYHENTFSRILVETSKFRRRRRVHFWGLPARKQLVDIPHGYKDVYLAVSCLYHQTIVDAIGCVYLRPSPLELPSGFVDLRVVWRVELPVRYAFVQLEISC